MNRFTIKYDRDFNKLSQREGDRLHSVMTTMNTFYAYRHWEDDLWVSSKVGNVAVEWDALLRSTSLAHSQGHTQDGISTKFS